MTHPLAASASLARPPHRFRAGLVCSLTAAAAVVVGCGAPDEGTGPANGLPVLPAAPVGVEDEPAEDVDLGLGYIEKDGQRAYFSALEPALDDVGCGPEMLDLVAVFAQDGGERRVHLDLYPGWFEGDLDAQHVDVPSDVLSASATLCTEGCEEDTALWHGMGQGTGVATVSGIDGWALTEAADVNLKFSGVREDEETEYLVVLPAVPLDL